MLKVSGITSPEGRLLRFTPGGNGNANPDVIPALEKRSSHPSRRMFRCLSKTRIRAGNCGKNGGLFRARFPCPCRGLPERNKCPACDRRRNSQLANLSPPEAGKCGDQAPRLSESVPASQSYPCKLFIRNMLYNNLPGKLPINLQMFMNTFLP